MLFRSGGTTTGGSTTSSYTIGGTVSGLATGESVTLQNNSGDDMVVSSDGLFTFPTAMDKGLTYNISVSAQPAGQICSVANNSGTIATNDITDINVTCTATTTSAGPYTIGGTVSGLATGESVTLQNNSGDNLIVSSDGLFTFPTAMDKGLTYNISVSRSAARRVGKDSSTRCSPYPYKKTDIK